MIDPVRTLLADLEEEIAKVPGGRLVLTKGVAGEGRVDRFKTLVGKAPPPGYAAFITQFDGATLGPDTRVFSFEESARKVQEIERAAPEGGAAGVLKGLWPVVERGPRLFALDAETGGDGEWPVVEVADRAVDRAGSSFLRFLLSLTVEVGGGDREPLELYRDICAYDPSLASNWVDLADELERTGKMNDVDEVLAAGIASANPPGPALVLAAGLRAVDRDDLGHAAAALEDALTLEPLTARDDDARLDAAAVSLVMALDRGHPEAATRAREILGPAAASTAAYWRGEAIRALVAGELRRGALALRIVETLVPEDADVQRLRDGTRLREALQALVQAREALDRGNLEEAASRARASVAERGDLGLAYAVLAEALNATRERGALDAAKKATEQNPALVEGWRELGDAYLEGRQAAKAEEAYRRALGLDGSYGFGMAKLAQALLEQGRTIEALEMISAAHDRGGDPFFLAAVRGDILAEMNRHREAAESYDQALRLEPEDHWVLHQAALEHSRAGNDARAADLFERALHFDREGCHQTLVDYGDLLRRVGRIGDAVKLYRRAVAASPNDPEWRQILREAEKELQQAPN